MTVIEPFFDPQAYSPNEDDDFLDQYRSYPVGAQELLIGQLLAELRTATGLPELEVYINVSGEGDDRRQVVQVSREADDETVLAVLATHRPDPEFGTTDAQRLRTQLVAKLTRGEVLDTDELHSVLCLLLGAPAPFVRSDAPERRSS